ncbi:MAG: ChbG/HpnK family deacetylase [Oscillospiraceae bacterium]|nr:ChbG/HpnK family deacetylase [Oscillospiraceae bacterium]
MKLLVQGDDYGFTKGVTYGILDAIDNGVLRNTGIFSNMPIAPWAVELWKAKDRSHACLGIDFNIVSGPPAADSKSVPSLLDDKGEFVRSGARLKDPRFQTEEGRREMFPYEEVYRELRAQYDRYVALVGKKPGYLHAHSLGHEHYNEAISQLSREEGVPYSQDIQNKYNFSSLFKKMPGGGMPKDPSKNKKVFDPMEQLNKTPLENFMKYADEFLQEEYVSMGGHPGFVDGELMGLTTLSLERMRDHEAVTSPILKNWIEDNGVELITYYDLY